MLRLRRSLSPQAEGVSSPRSARAAFCQAIPGTAMVLGLIVFGLNILGLAGAPTATEPGGG